MYKEIWARTLAEKQRYQSGQAKSNVVVCISDNFRQTLHDSMSLSRSVLWPDYDEANYSEIALIINAEVLSFNVTIRTALALKQIR